MKQAAVNNGRPLSAKCRFREGSDAFYDCLRFRLQMVPSAVSPLTTGAPSDDEQARMHHVRHSAGHAQAPSTVWGVILSASGLKSVTPIWVSRSTGTETWSWKMRQLPSNLR